MATQTSLMILARGKTWTVAIGRARETL